MELNHLRCHNSAYMSTEPCPLLFNRCTPAVLELPQTLLALMGRSGNVILTYLSVLSRENFKCVFGNTNGQVAILKVKIDVAIDVFLQGHILNYLTVIERLAHDFIQPNILVIHRSQLLKSHIHFHGCEYITVPIKVNKKDVPVAQHAFA